MRVLLVGSEGKMGTTFIRRAVLDGDVKISERVDYLSKSKGVRNSFAQVENDVDIIIEFAFHEVTKDTIDFAIKKNKPLLIATTGHTEEEEKIIFEASKHIPVFYAPNYSLGMAVLIKLSKEVIKILPECDIEIVEKHHRYKEDSPSGTAMQIYNAINLENELVCVKGRAGRGKKRQKEVGISAVRIGNKVGEHEIMFAIDNEIITLKHEAMGREVFVDGAIRAGKFLIERQKGLYNMNDLTEGKI